jgi:hypothetical protein
MVTAWRFRRKGAGFGPGSWDVISRKFTVTILTGKVMNRPALTEVLERIKQGPIATKIEKILDTLPRIFPFKQEAFFSIANHVFVAHFLCYVQNNLICLYYDWSFKSFIFFYQTEEFCSCIHY